MKHLLKVTVAGIALTAGTAFAGGIDRSGQSVGILFEEGNYAEFSLGYVTPSVDGNDVPAFGGGSSGSVASGYSQLGFGYKQQINDKLSFAVIIDQPFGAQVSYASTSVALGGTKAVAKATAVTGLIRYKFGNGFSAHGGLRAQQASASVTLKGLAYGPMNGYNVDLASDYGFGYVVGVAYEKPEIALRVALTYSSAIEHKFDTVETVNGAAFGAGTTTSDTPKSINLDFQSGVAKNTLVFGSIRWVDWSSFKLDPAAFFAANSGGLISLSNSTTYTLGVGRKFNDTWSGAVSVSYESAGKKLVSPLAPTTGKLGITLAGIYRVNNMKITVGINYTTVGDATPETGTPDVARANFTGNSATGVGVKVGWTF